MGCATQKYAGPAIENPWSIKNYGTATPDSSFLEQLRFYRDYEPLYRILYDGQKTSDADTSPFDATAGADTLSFNADLADTSSFNADLADTSLSGGEGTDSLFALDPPADSTPSNNIGFIAGDSTDYSAILPSSDDSFLSDIIWDANTDLWSNLFANSDSEPTLYSSKERIRRSARDFLLRG